MRFFPGFLRKLLANALRNYKFWKQFRHLKALQEGHTVRFSFNWQNRFPCLLDNTPYTAYDRHYVLHTAWAARVLNSLKPEVHYDVSSSLYFNAIVSAFIPVKFYDFRPAKMEIPNLEANTGNLLNLPFGSGTIPSLSCMHTIEHIGLGRYGDTLDYNGDLKAIGELKRVVRSGGDLLVVVPVAHQPVIRFNAHRIYAAEQFISYFDGFQLMEFCLIPENESDGEFVINPPAELLERSLYDCGCFWFRKQ